MLPSLFPFVSPRIPRPCKETAPASPCDVSPCRPLALAALGSRPWAPGRGISDGCCCLGHAGDAGVWDPTNLEILVCFMRFDGNFMVI